MVLEPGAAGELGREVAVAKGLEVADEVDAPADQVSSFAIAATSHSCCENLSGFLRQRCLIGGRKWVGPEEITLVQGLPNLPGDIVFPGRRVELNRFCTPGRRLRSSFGGHLEQALPGSPIAVEESQTGGLHLRVSAGGGIALKSLVFVKKLQPDGLKLAERRHCLRAQTAVCFRERRTRAAVAWIGFLFLFGEGSIFTSARFRQLTCGAPGSIAIKQTLKACRQIGEVGFEQKSGGETGQKGRLKQR